MSSNHNMDSLQKIITRIPDLQSKIEAIKSICPEPCDTSGLHVHAKDGVKPVEACSPGHADNPETNGRTARAHFYQTAFEKLLDIDLPKHNLAMVDGHSLMHMAASHYDAGYVAERFVLTLCL